MGLFDHLFKPKTDSAPEEHVEAEPAPEAAPPTGAAVAIPPPKPLAVAPPTAFAPRSLGQVVTPGRAGPSSPRSGPTDSRIKAGDAEEKTAREIVLTLGDVLGRIPKELLVEGMHDGRRVLRFAVDDLSADIARGRAAVPLSQIAEQCPEIFRAPVGEDDDMLIRLPLQKLVEQIAPGGGAPGASPRSLGGESPASGDAKIHLSIAAILRTCPREIIVGELPSVADTERIVFPFAPIERQLPSGRVDVSSIRFVAALPLHMHEYFRAIEGVRVPLPLDEIFQNLPGLPAVPPGVLASTPTAGTTPEAAPAPVPVHARVLAPEPAAVPAVASALTVAPAPVSASEPLPATEALAASAPVAMPPPEEPPRLPPEPSAPTPHVDLAKDEIAALRARIAALKVEFNVPAAEPAAPPLADPSLPAAEPPSPAPAAAVSEPIPFQAAPAVSPPAPPASAMSFVPAPGPRPSVPPSLGLERPPSGPPPVSVPAPAPELAPPPVSTPISVPAPMPELFRPPLVPPPVEPVIVPVVPKIEPPAPVMLPVRIVAPPPVRPHVAPPPLFSAGGNVALPEVHAPEPVVEPEPPPPPPLALERVGTALGIEGALNLARVAEQLATLPGLGACLLDVRHEAAEAGSFAARIDAAAIRALIAPLAAALAGREGEHITIFGEHGSTSVFARGAARLAVLHRARVFLPGVRERLVAAVEALAEA